MPLWKIVELFSTRKFLQLHETSLVSVEIISCFRAVKGRSNIFILANFRKKKVVLLFNDSWLNYKNSILLRFFMFPRNERTKIEHIFAKIRWNQSCGELERGIHCFSSKCTFGSYTLSCTCVISIWTWFFILISFDFILMNDVCTKIF